MTVVEIVSQKKYVHKPQKATYPDS